MRYKLVRLLGQGGMGQVYLADDTQLNRQVALKLPHIGPGSTSTEFRERFLREARAAAALSHPNICPLYDAGQAEGLCYLTMAYVPGQSLAEAIEGGRALPAREAAALVHKLARALEHAHAAGIIHRDLKPGNVMLDVTGEPIIMDFGLARLLTRADEAQLTQSGDVVGTPAFMAPEQALGQLDQVGPPTDIYALGVILYRLLTGRLPYEGTAISAILKAIHEPATPPSQFVPGLAPKLEWICLRAMAKTPGERFATMGTLATALAEVLDGGSNLASGSATGVPLVQPIVADLSVPGKLSGHDSTPPTPYPYATRSRPLFGWRGLAIGCVAMLALTVGVAGAIGWVIYKGVNDTINWISDLSSDNEVWVEVARFWRPPPAGTSGEQLFPAEFEQYKRTSFDQRAQVSDLSIDSAGEHAAYTGRQGQVDLYVYRAGKDQTSAIFEQAKHALASEEEESSDGATSGSGMNNGGVYHYSSGTPAGSILRYSRPASTGRPADYLFMWSSHDWVFLARSASDQNVDDFLKDYLRQLGGPTPEPVSK
jgi:serine/threonine protein kinase